ncbi:hypothetical protein HOF65_01995 [bacterium]|nr:hypothetical protein [bacterium]MBT3852781.1 hypothetical protein [bacterium]MBT6778803.1 hypothetical protein [bacterium]
MNEKNNISNNKTMLDYKKYKKRFDEIYPNLSDTEREEIFHLRTNFWQMIVDNYDGFNHK